MSQTRRLPACKKTELSAAGDCPRAIHSPLAEGDVCGEQLLHALVFENRRRHAAFPWITRRSSWEKGLQYTQATQSSKQASRQSKQSKQSRLG